MKLHEFPTEFRDLISIVASRKHLPESAVERDYGNIYPSDGYVNGGHKVTKSKRKCKDCTSCRNGWYGKAGEYVCIGVPEPFVIENIESECTEY